MLSTLDKNAVEIFLKLCKTEIKKGNCKFINYRKVKINGKVKNALQELFDIGIMKIEDIWNYVLDLDSSECFKISFDYDKRRDNNSEIYEFIKIINKKKVYIKLTYRNKVICLSFHESNY